MANKIVKISNTQTKREQFAERLARLVMPLIVDPLSPNHLSWDYVTNDLLSICAGIISVHSSAPQSDLAKASKMLREYPWERAKSVHFAATQGFKPEEAAKFYDERTAAVDSEKKETKDILSVVESPKEKESDA